jgi:hypothetical protein
MDGFGQLINPPAGEMLWFWGGLKMVYLFTFGLYGAFALVVLIQIRNMTSVISQPFNRVILTIGVVHMVVALLAILTAFVIL